MRDNLRRYRAIRAAVTQGYPGKLHGQVARHCTTLAALISGIVGRKSTHLPHSATHVPDGKKPESRVKRFARWVRNAQITADVYCVPDAKVLLAQLALQRLVLVIDGSVVGRGCIALLIHVVYKGRALPLVWLVRQGTRCAMRPVDWRDPLLLSAVLLTLWCQHGRTEHLGAEFAWMEGVKGRGNQSCCGLLDCVEATVALLEQEGLESTVMIGETVLTLPSLWVHPSRGATGMWCFIPQTTTGGQPAAYVDRQGRTRAIPPETPTRENTRCAFFISLN